MLSFGFRIFCWYRGFCHRTGSDLLLFLSYLPDLNPVERVFLTLKTFLKTSKFSVMAQNNPKLAISAANERSNTTRHKGIL